MFLFLYLLGYIAVLVILFGINRLPVPFTDMFQKSTLGQALLLGLASWVSFGIILWFCVIVFGTYGLVLLTETTFFKWVHAVLTERKPNWNIKENFKKFSSYYKN